MSLAASCHWHPERRAIGVCVETGESMCAECSTSFRGVNLSREGVERRLEAERARGRASVGGRGRTVTLQVVGWLAVAPAMWVLWAGWHGSTLGLIRLVRALTAYDGGGP